MPDIVQSNEFVFTPSAFVCAYIEQKAPSETIVETNAFGAINKSISPQNVDPVTNKSSMSFTPMSEGFSGSSDEKTPGGVFNVNFPGDFVGAKEKFFARVDGIIPTENGANVTIVNTAEQFTPANPNLTGDSIELKSGIHDVGNALQLTGDITSLVGVNETAQQRTDSKTTVKTIEELATVVLVLTYGEFRAKCSNPQGTLNSIYTQVLAYFNSL
jgi:hypothetical protein